MGLNEWCGPDLGLALDVRDRADKHGHSSLEGPLPCLWWSYHRSWYAIHHFDAPEPINGMVSE